MDKVYLDQDERIQLKEYLERHFDLGELQNLAFELGASYKAFRWRTQQGFVDALIKHCEPGRQLSRLLLEIMRKAPSQDMLELLVEFPPLDPPTKVVVLLAKDHDSSESEVEEMLLADLLRIPDAQLVVMAAAHTSLRLLLGLPKETAQALLLRSKQHTLEHHGWRVTNVFSYESLDQTSQQAWRWLAIKQPPALSGNMLKATISWPKALEAAQVLGDVQDLGADFAVIENGQIISENPPDWVSSRGGPGKLFVGTGNAVILERRGKSLRIEGPGEYELERFEFLKQPIESTGIVDLRPQSVSGVAENVLTHDGIPLSIAVSMFYQIGPVNITDQRFADHAKENDINVRVIGEPVYPVYEAVIRKAVFDTPLGGLKSLFPLLPIQHLRDVVAAYSLEQLFLTDPSVSPDPDTRAFKEIEHEVKRRFDASWAGAYLKSFTISEITMPDYIRRQLLERSSAPIQRRIMLENAEMERGSIVLRGEAQAKYIRDVEAAKIESVQSWLPVVDKLRRILPASENDLVAAGFLNIVHAMLNRVGSSSGAAGQTPSAAAAKATDGTDQDKEEPEAGVQIGT